MSTCSNKVIPLVMMTTHFSCISTDICVICMYLRHAVHVCIFVIIIIYVSIHSTNYWLDQLRIEKWGFFIFTLYFDVLPCKGPCFQSVSFSISVEILPHLAKQFCRQQFLIFYLSEKVFWRIVSYRTLDYLETLFSQHLKYFLSLFSYWHDF